MSSQSGLKSKVTYTVSGPEMIATKAMGTIDSTYTLYYEVRLWDGTTLGSALTGTGLSGNKEVAANAWPVNIELDLARNQQYKILFWAQSNDAPTGLYTNSDLSAVAIDYTKMEANNEDCDAFSGYDVITPAGASAVAVTLTRPFALVNLGASDAAQFHTASGGLTVGSTSVEISGKLGNSFNVASGAATAYAESATITAAPIDAYDATTLTVATVGYNYLHAVYVLPYEEEEVGVAYTIKDKNSNDITALNVTNVPVKPNYRTNIVGKILTGTTVYNINVDQAFAADMNKPLGKSFSSIADLNTYFAAFAASPYNNGIAQPEDVTLTAISGDEPTITLPAIASDVVIRIPNAYDGTLTIQYASGDLKPANLSLYAPSLTKLVANITSTHFTLLSGSHITDQAEVQTSSTTFVIQQNAKVGTLNIKQGNAKIAGEVATVEVVAGATADGTNPVEVFVENTAAVEQITLSAPTDVVVEQPKDNIDVAATENKVNVYVNETAAGSTATAQNGGQIYVEYIGAQVEINAVGTDESDNASSVYIKEVKDEVTVVTDATEGATIETNTGVVVDEIIRTVEQFDAAVEAKKTSMTIGNDITFTKGYTIEFATDINLNGNKLTFTSTGSGYPNDRAFKIAGSDAITVTFHDGEISVDDNLYGPFRTDNANLSLILDNLKLNNGRSYGLGIKVVGANAVTMNGVELTSNVGGGIEVGTSANISFDENTKIIQTNLDQQQPWISAAIGVCDGATLNIEAGTYRAVTAAAFVYSSGGTINVSGGTFVGTDDKVIMIQNNTEDEEWVGPSVMNITGGSFTGGIALGAWGKADPQPECTLNISGGYFNVDSGDLFTISGNSNIVITGGYFSQDPSAFIPEGYSATLNSEGLYVVELAPTVFNVSTVAEFNAVFTNTAALKTKNTKININADIDLTNAAVHTPNNLSGGSWVVTINGNNHTIKGLQDELFTEAVNGAVVNVNDLTFDSANINKTSDKYVAVIMGYADCNGGINVSNVTFKNCNLTGLKHLGLVYGYGAGWDKQNDGPVFMNSTISGCVFDGCQLVTTEGSAGIIAGHVAGNAWTRTTVNNTTVKNCSVTCEEANKAGSLFGTIGVAGTAEYGMVGGTYVNDSKWFHNTVTAGGNTVTRTFGRVASTGGKYWIDGELAAYNARSGDVVLITMDEKTE